MTDNFPEKTSFETLARKYALKGERIYIDGPIDYKGNSYWAIFYEMKKFLKKPVRTCVIVTDSNQRIVTDKDVFKEIAQVFLLPRPNIYFKEIYEGEKKDLLGIQRYFDPENYALEIDLLQFIEDAKKLSLPTISKELENFVNHYKKINEIIEKILDMKENVKELLELMMQEKVDQELTNKFLDMVIVKEGNLIKNLLEAFYVKRELLQRLKNEIEKRKTIERIPKNFEKLLKYIKHGIKAVNEVDEFLKYLIKIRVDIKKLYEKSRRTIDEFYKEMLKRTEKFE